MSSPDEQLQPPSPQRDIRLLFWNVFLLRPRLVPGGPPLPPVGDLAAPAAALRARQIGEALAGNYDVAAFAEAFEPAERSLLLEAWSAEGAVESAVGPSRSFPPRGPAAFATSGLLTVTDHLPIVRRAAMVFETRGSRVHDADAWANKGALLVELDPGVGGARLEVVSTHLIWGTGLIGGSRARDPRRRHELRMAQVDELVRFIEGHHRRENGLVLVGDFNVPAHDPTAPGGPQRWYDDLCERLAPLGLVDTWAEAGIGLGPTCGAATDPFDEDDADAPGMLRDDLKATLGEGRERIDYVFVRRATTSGELAVSFDRPRRRAFRRQPGSDAYDKLPRLSDHLALSVNLHLRAPAGA